MRGYKAARADTEFSGDDSAVLTLLWRQVPSVCELRRVLAREDCLWAPRLKVSQQALSQRFLSFPAALFQRVLWALLRLAWCSIVAPGLVPRGEEVSRRVKPGLHGT
jgi:hypothetical protein